MVLSWSVCLSRGGLQTRSLSDIVRKEDLVDSEYLTTLLVVVTRLVTFILWHYTSVFECLYSCVGLYVFQRELLEVGRNV